MLDRESALRTVRKILTADFACEERCFDAEGVFIFEAKEVAGSRRFPLPEKSLFVVTMGKGVVVSCSADRMQWVVENLSHLTREEIFSPANIARMGEYVALDGQVMRSPELKYICTQDRFQPCLPPADIDVVMVEKDGMQELYETGRFPNAMGYRLDPARPRMTASVARYGEQTVGVAGAAADHDEMWQVGIDVLPDYRRRGIGKALVSRLTESLFTKEKLPYYLTSVSNILSRRLAVALGYWPAWVDFYSGEAWSRTPAP